MRKQGRASSLANRIQFEASVIKGSQTQNFEEESRCEPSAVCAFISAVTVACAAAIYEVCTFRPVGRQPELGGRKKDDGGALKWFEETRQVLLGCRTMIIESPLQLIFRDLFYRLPAFAESHDVFLKLEGFNITGSIKVKTAIGLVEDLEQRGMARPDKTVLVESSSGNLGLALSLVCAIKGYKFICVTDPNANRTTIRGMELYGAKVIVVEDRDPAGGYLGSRLKKIDQILQSDPNAVWLHQYANIANKNVHAEQTANEIAREFDKVDWVFVGTGSTRYPGRDLRTTSSRIPKD